MIDKRMALMRNDTVTLLLCNQVHRFLSDRDRALKIAKCAKIVRDRTKDVLLYNVCRSAIKHASSGKYSEAIKGLNNIERAYCDRHIN